MATNKIPFNKPYITGKESGYLANALALQKFAGDGTYTRQCHQWLEKNTASPKALLTHSCTAALEMAALLLDLQAGDEIIMPSYTFVSTANAFVLRNAVPVFIDIRHDTLNIDEHLIEQAITPRTKAIVVVHYAGVACEMDTILAIAKRHHLRVIEDAAQGIMSTYKGKSLGAIGDLGAYSFHETKNIISGEGGALLVNDPDFIIKAEIIREKGTDRSRFFRGEIDKYTWQETGSSYLPSELIAAFLFAQLEQANDITKKRLSIWNTYHELFKPMEEEGLLRRPVIPAECQHNGHMYYVLFPDSNIKERVYNTLTQLGISAPFHYIPLHSSPAGKKYSRVASSMRITDTSSACLLRMPFWCGIEEHQDFIAESVRNALR